MSTPTEPHLEQHTEEHPRKYVTPPTTMRHFVGGWFVILMAAGILTVVSITSWLIPLAVTAVFVLH